MRRISECAVMEPICLAPPPFGQSTPPLETTTTTSSSSSSSMAAIIETPSIIQTTMAINCQTKQINSSSSHQIPSDILDDLASRFIINVPDDERNNLIRICFQIELAHWFYLDFFCSIEEKKLVPCGIKQFATLLFHHIPFLRIHLSGIDKILEDWKEYKLSVPTYGAILMSEDLKYVLLVQSYWAKSSWGFPKGKVNEHEDPIHCATREVFEETGYDITGLIVPNDYIEAVINYQYTRLYLVRNVPLQTLFLPRTRKEIKCCEWFPVDSLPTNKNDAISKANLGINANSFFMIMPFIKRLKKWVFENRSGIETTSLSSCTTIALSSSSSSSSSVQSGTTVAPQTTTTTATPFSSSSVSSSSLSSKSSNGRKGDQQHKLLHQQNGNGFALSNYKNLQYGCNGKRQRHKSMGDIDGIKINITSNCNNLSTKLLSGTKSNLTTPNCVNYSMTSDNFNFKREKYTKTNSKRQLFNSCSSSSSFSSNNISSSSSICSNTGYLCTSTSLPITNSVNFDNKYNKINFEYISKSNSVLNCNSSSTKTNRNQQKFINKSKSKSVNNMQIHSKSTSNINISKMSPNLDSWTSFTFTKNFIANVFC